MRDEQEYKEAINFLLWGKKGYPEPHGQSPSEFSIEKILIFLKQKQESANADDI
ncbi:MAG: hypothetical protein JSV50_01200 [Desulfobacteraceae bacterium]|nr:MAG: hypothetical protein JSV50_01200 [Desulfobacteraceae bacterium]